MVHKKRVPCHRARNETHSTCLRCWWFFLPYASYPHGMEISIVRCNMNKIRYRPVSCNILFFIFDFFSYSHHIQHHAHLLKKKLLSWMTDWLQEIFDLSYSITLSGNIELVIYSSHYTTMCNICIALMSLAN